jgi:hypothetical protein
MHIGYWWESQKVTDHWEDQDVGGWVGNIKMDLREIEWDGMNWIDLTQDRDQWRALVNTFGFHKMPGTSLVAAQLATSQRGLNSMSE